MGNVCTHRTSAKAPPNPHPPDPLPNRTHDHNRTTKDDSLLRTATKAQGYSGICSGHNAHIAQVGVCWLCGGAVRHLHTIRRLFEHDSQLRVQHPCDRTIHCKGIIICKRRDQKQGAASMMKHGEEKSMSMTPGGLYDTNESMIDYWQYCIGYIAADMHRDGNRSVNIQAESRRSPRDCAAQRM